MCLWLANHSLVYVKENFQESHFPKNFRSVNLLQSLCRIVKFINNLYKWLSSMGLRLRLSSSVLIRTVGDELSPSGTVVGSISRVIRINTQCVQIFLQCVLPCPLWSSGPPPATFWSPHFIRGCKVIVIANRLMIDTPCRLVPTAIMEGSFY